MTQALAGTGTAVQLQVLEEPDYGYADWWKTDKGLIAFQNEVIKYLYYRYRYAYPQASPTSAFTRFIDDRLIHPRLP